ncbi:monovalent cation/proton antiporter, MnhG/PhaG subunit [Staphylothermus marinus F1]|uniref:Monovalent cation/proton antiporter, MnhG/PhaG subunit n=1 Tax=Staphylothermus marinus (strain ATCC 43588 / DSM 3639 / JCM 9404 / F1) TaxID=399550 RepID=A3DNF4_STAMF|nr:monovalent cation/H(+) antiporter subunit G [Staphylothermus marinus]ABN70164.1 monovalent cation/proton antiporter, MnhG/PhaG subunit [Staphylothermus marinus F1]
MFEELLVYFGEILVVIGVFCDLAASIGMIRFPNFYTRMHAATVGTIGGAVVPLIGVAFIALGSTWLGVYRFFLSGASFVAALLIMILAPVGTHVLAQAAHHAGLAPKQPINFDHLEEDLKYELEDKKE